MRLFTGLSIGSEVLGKLEQALRELQPAADLNWSPPDNLHITTKFIGEWPERRLNELRETLAGMAPGGPFSITIGPLGFYPAPHHARVLFAGVRGGAELNGLARRIDEALATLGCAREQRPYSPHVTLARIKTEDIRQLREQIALMENMNKFDFGSFEAVGLHLYLSVASPQGSVYTKVSTFPLVRAV